MSKLINELSTLSTITGSDQVIVYGTGSSTTGKVSIDSLVTAGGAVMSHDDTAAFVGNTGGQSNLFFLQSTLNSTNSTYGGDRAGLIIKSDGLQVWNNTKSQAIWTLSNTITTLLTDCNNGTDPFKLYYCNTSTANRPSSDGTWFELRCLWPGTYCTQMAWVENTQNMGRFWLRSKNASGWGSWYLYTIPSQSIKIVSGVSGTITIPAKTAKSINVTISIPSGYTRVMNGPCRTNGFVGSAYLSEGNTIWCSNPFDNQVSGTINWEVLCVANN